MFVLAYVASPGRLSPTLVAFAGGEPLYARGGAEDLAQPFDTEIGLTGKYKARNFELSSKQFDEMIKNHHAAGVDPAIDREHESWFSLAAQPALGWVKALEVRPATADKRRSALVATVHLNDLGQAAVKNSHFRYVSMGFDKAGKGRQSGEPIGAVLDHLALVKNPFIQGMRPLSLALSAKLGRPVEEDPMELLAQKLRSDLGLAAEASEEQIVQALDARQKAAAAEAAKAATNERLLDEQKRVNERVVAEIERLSKDSEAQKTAQWLAAVTKAVADFRLTPAEAAEYEKLTGAERDVSAKLLALRVPHKPAGEAVALNKAAGTAQDGRARAQNEAVAAYQKDHPGIEAQNAFMACALAQPELFNDGEVL